MTKTSAIIVIILLGVAGYEMIITNSALRASLVIYDFISSTPSWNNCDIYIYIYMWTWSLPWHKVLNAVVAELGIHKLND